MKKTENLARQGQRAARDATRKLKKGIKNSEITKTVKTKVGDIAADGKRKYDDIGAGKLVQKGSRKVVKATESAMDLAKAVDNRTGLSKGTNVAKDMVKTNVLTPAQRKLDEAGFTDSIKTTAAAAGNAFGEIRTIVKPYFDPVDADELLSDTNKQLTAITACILQISKKDAEGWMGSFGKLVTAKIAGVAGTATLFGLVSTFGTAGTGVAISTLSGAAANSAALAALGFGGGMAAGALVLTGFGTIVGVAAYKFMSPNPRDFNTLPVEDKQIVETCGILGAAIKEKLIEAPLELSAHEALHFRIALEKLHHYLKTNADKICKRLDGQNSFKYRQCILRDFEPTVLKAFTSYISKAPFCSTNSAMGIIGGVFYAFLSRTAIDGSPEEKLVLEALRRSDNDLHHASESELSDYLQVLTSEQLQGVANNVKGIYHELLWVENYNSNNSETYAELYASTTHQGADVMIKSRNEDEVLSELQLKATDSKSYVREHQLRYEDVKVAATDEVALKMEEEGVVASEILNSQIIKDVDGVFNNVSDNTLGNRVLESAEYTALAAAGLNAINVLRGKKNISTASKNTLITSSSAAAATSITAFLFG